MKTTQEQLTPDTVEAVRALARRAHSETWTTTAGKGLSPLYVAVGGRIVAMDYGDWLIMDNTTKRLSVRLGVLA